MAIAEIWDNGYMCPAKVKSNGYLFLTPFSTSLTLPSFETIKLSALGAYAHDIFIGNDETEPPYAVSAQLLPSYTEEGGVRSYPIFTPAATAANKSIVDVAKSYPATLTRQGKVYTLTTDYPRRWKKINVETTDGASYSVCFFDGVMANGTTITSGTDADGNTITEASYTETGQSWTMDLVANLPTEPYYKVAMLRAWELNQVLIYDEIGAYYACTDNGTYISDIQATRASWQPDDAGTTACACAEDVKIGALVYPSRIGYVAYSSGWTSPLMAWRREEGSSSAAVFNIQCNGMATYGHYLDDDGKPYSGIVYSTRPENYYKGAWVDATKRLRTVSFFSVLNLDALCPYAIANGMCWITAKERDGEGYQYDGIYLEDDENIGLSHSEDILAPLGSSEGGYPMSVFGFEGGAHAVAIPTKGGQLPTTIDTSLSWGSFSTHLYNIGTCIYGDITMKTDADKLASQLNPVGAAELAISWEPPIATTAEQEILSGFFYRIYVKAWGGQTIKTAAVATITDGAPIVEFSASIDPAKISTGLFMFSWAPAVSGWSPGAASVYFFNANTGKTTGQQTVPDDTHVFAFLVSSDGEDITEQDYQATGDYVEYTVYRIPYSMVSEAGSYSPNSFKLTWRTSGIPWGEHVGEKIFVNFWRFAALPYSE